MEKVETRDPGPRPEMKSIWVAALAAVGAGFLTGSSTMATETDSSLDGTAWVLEMLPPEPAAIAGAQPTARFEGSRVYGRDGCNRYRAQYTIKGSEIEIRLLGSTLMACEPEVMKRAEAFTIALTAVGDGKVTGSAGCNRYTSTYQADGTRLKFTPAVATDEVCASAEVMGQEQAFFRALETVTTKLMEGDELEARTAEGALAMAMTLVRNASP
jgi:heat shock protein HslJ